MTVVSIRTICELCLALISQAGGLYGRILTEVMSTDRTQWGLSRRLRSRFSHTDRLIRCLLHTPKRYNLRNADFNIPRFRTVHYGKHSLRYFGPHLWNKLDKTDREKPIMLRVLKAVLRELSHLIDNRKNSGYMLLGRFKFYILYIFDIF